VLSRPTFAFVCAVRDWPFKALRSEGYCPDGRKSNTERERQASPDDRVAAIEAMGAIEPRACWWMAWALLIIVGATNHAR